MDDDEHNPGFESVDNEDEYEEVYEAEDEDDDDDEEEFDDDEVEKQMSDIGDELKCSQFQTLDVSDFVVESHLLSEVPVEYTMEVNNSAENKNQVVVSHQEPLISVTALDAQTHFQNEIQFPGCPTSSLELSPTSVTQSISSGPSPALHEQRVLPVVDQQKSSHLKPVSAVRAVKTPSADGYNWRKYGQKQVKSPQGSRSYYKCTFLECCSKKIECCDHSNSDIKIIYRGVHNHDPPRKSNCTRENRLALSVASVVDNTVHPIKTLDDTNPPPSSIEPIQEIAPIPDKNQQNSSGSNGNAEIYVEEHVDEPEPKRRMKQSSAENPGSLIKPGKNPKYVVHAAGDVGISGDGYRWRKYGQKMVKGNPHPRNYYKCTSAGCPVRKHIERAVDSTTAVIITYKGTHDHDMPVPKKRHGQPSAPLVAAAAPVSMNSNMLYRKNEALQNQISTTQWSVDTDGELTCEALDLGEEKAMESARTLLSIGFEIKPC